MEEEIAKLKQRFIEETEETQLDYKDGINTITEFYSRNSELLEKYKNKLFDIVFNQQI